MTRGVNDNAEGERRFAAAPLALFLPVAVILAGYGLLYLGLAAAGRGDGALARLCMIVVAFVVPFLLAHALLRNLTIAVQPMPHGLMLHAGFPSLRRRWLGWHDIAAVDVRRGPMGWLTGGGTLAMRLSDGSRVVVADLAHPDHAAALIKAMAAASRQPAAEPLLSAA